MHPDGKAGATRTPAAAILALLDAPADARLLRSGPIEDMMADTPAPAAPTLYRPDAYAALEPERIVDDYPFATLLSPELHATTTPMLFERSDRATLIGHLARRGSHAQAMRTGDRGLCCKL